MRPQRDLVGLEMARREHLDAVPEPDGRLPAPRFEHGQGSGAAPRADLPGLQAVGARTTTETEWSFLVVETGLAGVLIFLALNFRIMGLALVHMRRIARTPVQLQLAAPTAPLVGLLAAAFASPTTTSVPPAPYF